MTSHMLLRAVVGVAMTVLILFFAGKRLWFLIRLARSGKPAVGRLLDAPKRVQAEAFEVLGQRKLLKWTVPGVAHVFAFWGFLVLTLTILETYGAGVGAAFQTWYASDASDAYGGQFTYTQPFAITTGSVSTLQSVTVTLTNSQGVSSTMTANF